jgi:hypothetical protein
VTDLAHSNSLADLASRINAEHDAVCGALKRSLGHAITAGKLLIEAKAQLRHGQWMSWLKDHCKIPERTARLYMRVAKNEAEIGNVADLTLRGAVALLAYPLDSSASKVADREVENLDLAAAELAFAERAKRMHAYREAAAALEVIIELGGNTSLIGQAVWNQLGDQFIVATAHYRETLVADLEEPFALSLAATAAIFDARDIAVEMLRLVRNEEAAAS